MAQGNTLSLQSRNGRTCGAAGKRESRYIRFGLPGLAPLRAPQTARREDNGEERGHAQRDERPDEKEASAGIGDAAGDADTFPLHVEDGGGEGNERREEDDDVSGSPFGEHQSCVKPNAKDGHSHEKV